MTYNIPLISPNCKPHQNKSLAVSPTETDKTAEKKKSSGITKAILENNNKVKGLIFLLCKMSCKAFSNKRMAS